MVAGTSRRSWRRLAQAGVRRRRDGVVRLRSDEVNCRAVCRACAWSPVEALGSGSCVDLAGQDVLSGVCVAPGPKKMACCSAAFVARGRAFVARTVRQSASHGAWLHRKKLCGTHGADEEEASTSSRSCAACVAGVHGAWRVSLRTKMVAAVRMVLSMATSCLWRRSSACVAGAGDNGVCRRRR